jgi:hypothetical protein
MGVVAFSESKIFKVLVCDPASGNRETSKNQAAIPMKEKIRLFSNNHFSDVA